MEVVLYGYVNPCGTNDGAIFYFGGDSNSSKPESWHGAVIGEGSLFLELDTGDFYYFNEGSWEKVGGGSSDGGSADDDEVPSLIDGDGGVS